MLFNDLCTHTRPQEFGTKQKIGGSEDEGFSELLVFKQDIF